MDLRDINFNAVNFSMTYAPNNGNTGGVLSVTDGTNTANINFVGSYTQGNFHAATDSQGGTLITDPPVSSSSKATSVVASTATADPVKGIELSDIGVGAHATLGSAQNNNNMGGTLTVNDGTHAANIALLGQYMASHFAMSSDGHGGTLVTDPPPAVLHSQLSLSQPHA